MSDYGRIKKDSTFKNILVTAPNTYQKSDKETITNFNEDEALMKEYGYKPVITTEPPYDENYEALTVESLTQDDENIYLTYGVNRFANPPIGVDLSNYYTKQEVYNKKEIDNMLENLKSDSITTEDLYAINGEIENLKSNFAQIDMAEINRLTAAYADIEELKSKLANIDSATIKNLTTDVGNIKLLLNGHLTSDNIQSLVLTASKVTVEDAFIKDAMIDTINANKINTGVLNTNKVNIQSDDGSMTLKGNLQQFKDKDGKVRIQIGKDATGEFTFSLFNAEGTGVLIDETGIKSGAIGSGLIVDDMVSDNAHISGGKIDIDSLITNINGNTSTINSSKIKFDDTNQTLDVAFTALKTKVDSIEKITVDGDLSSVIKQVQSNTTDIKIQQGQISSLISNTTITTENGKTIQLKDAYNSTVSTVDSLVNKIGSLETNVSSSLTNSETQFYVSTSATSLEGGEWITDESPTWVSGKYVWQRVKYTYSNGGIKYSTPVCIQGAKGEKGDKGDKGEQGLQGIQGIQGEQGEQGIQGVAGKDGKTTYFHIKYSTNANGNPMTETPSTYIGTYVDYDPNDSIDYTAYKWSRFEGMQGEQGIPGTNGVNGETYYLHIKYSDDGGKTFTSNNGETAGAYIGVYTDTNDKDSELVSKYTWSKIKGDKGDQGLQGVPGSPGIDGKTYYTWIRYADTIDGSGISNDPTGKTYIGFAYNKETSTESNSPSDYTWSLIKGEKGDTGVQGEKGIDGKTYYTWIKYSDNADGTGLYDTPKDSTMYIGIAINKPTPNESSNKADYVWSRFKGDKGDQGLQGVPGKDGKTYYTWIKYADDDKGNGISDDPTGKPYIGLAYNKETSTESTNKTDYTWTLIKGEKGDTGVKGDTGADGTTYYTWIKYSDNADGTGLYDTPKDTTKYIGIGVNKTTPDESTNKADYTWSKFKGEQGVKGEDGKTYYTWIKYADSVTGEGISNDPTGKTYIGLAYNKTTKIESDKPSDYIWSLIKGDKGDQGVQGVKGEDGVTHYTWIKYSDNADGTGLYDTPKESTMYIGIAPNKTTATESNNKTDYIWSKFKGEKGDQGLQGVAGKDGKTYYTWIKYADDIDGTGISDDPTNKTYIGFAYNKTTADESTNKADYTWSLIKGEKGDQGVQGIKGTDGTTYYTWIKYSDNADGTGLYDTPKASTMYIGIAVNKTTQAESNTKTDYTWSRFKGEQGVKGNDGKTYYTWIKYADDDKGNGISNEPTGKTYIGLAYNKTTQTESNTPSDYTWSLIKGDKGDTGVKGEDGKDGITYYTWIKYSDNADGTGLYDVPKDTTNYIGIAINKTTPTESNNKTDYTWSRFKGDKGDKGDQGEKGEQGSQGQQGEKGDTGQSMTSSTPQWYASTSATTQTGGDWSDTMPTLEVGKYYWMRYKQTWKNPTKTTYTEPILEELGEAIKEVKSQQSDLEHTLDGFKQTVSKDYAKQTTVTDLTDKLAKDYTTTSDMNSIIDQKATGVLTTVSETYATTSSVTDLNTKLEKNYYTSTQVNSAIDQKANGILSTVSESYTTKSDFNNLTIGGRNLVKNSAFKDATHWSINDAASIDTIKKLDGCNSLKISCTGNTKDVWKGSTQLNIITNVKQGDTFTVSGYYFVQDKNTLDSDFTCELKGKINDVDNGVCDYTRFNKNNCVQGKWTYFYYVTKVSRDVDSLFIYPWIQRNGTVWFTKLKVEKGNKVTDWSPAPEDTDDAIKTIDGKFANYITTTSMNSAIDQKADSILSTVSTTYTTKTDFNNLSVGGRNLLIGTKNPNTTVVTKMFNNQTYYTYDPYATYNTKSLAELGLTAGDKLTVSLDYEVTEATTYGQIRVELVNSEHEYYMGYDPKDVTSSSTSGRYVATLTLDNNAVNASRLRIRVDKGIWTLKISNVKLEKGAIATDWTPAPEDTDNAINNINIGARNLVKNSAFKNTGYWSWDTQTSIDSTKKLDGCNSLKISLSGNTNNVWKGGAQRNIVSNVKKGDVFTVSGYYFVQDKNTFDSDFTCELKGRLNDSDISVCNYTRFNKDNCVQGQWTYFYYVATINQDVDSLWLFPWVQKNGTVWFAKFKVEKGNKPTDWSPAPEDIDNSINDVNNKFADYSTTTQMNSAIDQKATGILSTVSKTYTTKDELKELSVGGRNYLLDTKNAKTIAGTNGANQCTNLYLLSDAKSSCNGEKISVSFTYKVSNYTSGDFIIQTYGGSSEGWSRITPSSDGTFTYSHTISAPINFDSATGVQIRMDAFVGTVEISNMMLEKGNIIGDWTPAPEDSASLIEDLGDYVLNITKETVIVSTDLSGNMLS